MKIGTLLLCGFCAFLILASAFAAPVRAQGPDAATLAQAATVDRMFKASGYTYERKNDIYFRVERDSKIFFFAAGSETMIGGVVLVKKADYRLSVDSLTVLLRANHQYDVVKILIDDDGDISMRIEPKLRLIEQDEFNRLLKQFFNVANELSSKLQPYVIK